MNKVIIFLMVFGLLTGCASTKSKYPEFPEQVKDRASVQVVIDSIAISDIAGKDYGYNGRRNQKILLQVKDAVMDQMQIRGYAPQLVAELNGLFFDKKDDRDYFFSEGWKSTGEPYLTLLEQEGNGEGWHTAEVKTFFQDILDKEKSKSKQQSIESDNLANALPAVLKDNTNDLVLYIRAQRYLQSTSKQIGVGVLGGVLSGVLTGGALVLVPSQVINEVHAVAIDPDQQQILWFNSFKFDNLHDIGSAIKIVLRNYPDVSGHYWDVSDWRRAEKKRG